MPIHAMRCLQQLLSPNTLRLHLWPSTMYRQSRFQIGHTCTVHLTWHAHGYFAETTNLQCSPAKFLSAVLKRTPPTGPNCRFAAHLLQHPHTSTHAMQWCHAAVEGQGCSVPHLGRRTSVLQVIRALAKLLKMSCKTAMRCSVFLHGYRAHPAWSARAGLQPRAVRAHSICCRPECIFKWRG